MSKNTKIGMIATLVLFLAVFVAWCANNNAKAQEQIERGIEIERVTDHSFYVIDTRYDLCFYETQTVNGVSVVAIPGSIVWILCVL